MLGGAKLGEASLDGAVLIGADLDGADLKDAGLDGANLREARLGGALNLHQVQVDRACISDETRLPRSIKRREAYPACDRWN